MHASPFPDPRPPQPCVSDYPSSTGVRGNRISFRTLDAEFIVSYTRLGPATCHRYGGTEGRKVSPGFFFSYLGSLGLIFLLGILHGLQVVSGTVIVHKFPTPLGNSFLTQSQERGPWYSLFRGQDEDNRVARLLGPITKFHFLTALCPWDFPHYLDRMGILVRA